MLPLERRCHCWLVRTSSGKSRISPFRWQLAHFTSHTVATLCPAASGSPNTSSPPHLGHAIGASGVTIICWMCAVSWGENLLGVSGDSGSVIEYVPACRDPLRCSAKALAASAACCFGASAERYGHSLKRQFGSRVSKPGGHLRVCSCRSATRRDTPRQTTAETNRRMVHKTATTATKITNRPIMPATRCPTTTISPPLESESKGGGW